MRRLLVPLTALMLVVAGGDRRDGRAGIADLRTLRGGHLEVDGRHDRPAAPAWSPTTSPATSSGPSAYTSPTNIGGYLWSAVVADKLGIISRHEARARVSRTLHTLATLKHHDRRPACSTTGTTRATARWSRCGRRTAAPSPRSCPVSTTAGWRRRCGSSRARCRSCGPRPTRILCRDGLRLLLQPGRGHPGGRHGADRRRVLGHPRRRAARCRGDGVWFTCNHYDITVTEPRIATYLGIGAGQIPPEAYLPHHAHPAGHLRLQLAGDAAAGFDATYRGVPVFEGSYRYRGITFVPSWGGDMFEALMPDLFVPEATWGPNSWGRNHPATVAAQIEHGLNDASYGYWGFSPASEPVRRVHGLGRRRDGHGHRRLPVRRAGAASTTPASATAARPDHPAVVRRRRGHPARRVPGPAVREEGPALSNLAALRAELRRLRAGRLLRRGRGAQRHGRQAVPVPGPGHDHGRDRQRRWPATCSSGRS